MPSPEYEQPATPQQRIEAGLTQLMGDPQRIAAPERAHPDNPERLGEEPVVVCDREGRSLATLKTLADPQDQRQAMVVIRTPQIPRGEEIFNYYWSTGKVVHSSGRAGNPPYVGEEAQLRLADVLERLQLERDLG